MKSILFTVLRDKLESGEKTQTFRTNFIRKYRIFEIVNIDFKWIYDDVIHRETLFLARITAFYPKQVKDLTLEEAIRDGFISVKEFQDTIMELNKIKTTVKRLDFMLQWGFVTVFEKIPDVRDWLGGKS